MSRLPYIVRRRFFSLFHRTVRWGWAAVASGSRNTDMSRLGFGLILIGYGLVKGRSRRKLIYKTSIDVGEGTTIRVRQGRRPIAETAPIR